MEAGATPTTKRGTMRFDYDAASTVDLTVVERGALTFTYDVSSAGRDLHVPFDQFVGADGGDPVDASYHYHYQVETGAAGIFDFEAVTDLDAQAARRHPRPRAGRIPTR